MKIVTLDTQVPGRINDDIINTSLSQETKDALRAVDENIRRAHMQAQDILVG